MPLCVQVFPSPVGHGTTLKHVIWLPEKKKKKKVKGKRRAHERDSSSEASQDLKPSFIPNKFWNLKKGEKTSEPHFVCVCV